MAEDANKTVPAALRQEIASVRRDPTVPYWGNVMLPQDYVLVIQGGGRGLRIYREIKRDAHAKSVLNKRKNAVIAREWEVRPGGESNDDKAAAELAERFLRGEWGFAFDRMCKSLLNATLMGYAVVELIWGAVPDGFILPLAAKPRRQERFLFSPEWELRLITAEHLAEGEAVPPMKFLVHRNDDDSEDDPYGLGLGHQLFWPVLFKRQGWAFWMKFAEKFGSPTIKGEYDPTMPDDQQNRLLDTLVNLAQDSAFIVPQGTLVDLLEASRSGAVTYPDLVRYCDEEISKAVLGETLTTTAGEKGARSLGEVHNDVRAELTDGDADLLSGDLNAQLLTWITLLNYPNAAPPQVWRPRPEGEEERARAKKGRAEAMAATVSAVTAARNAGYEPATPQGSLDEHLDGDWTYTGRPVPAATPGFADLPRDAADDIADQLDTAAAATVGGMVDRVRAAIAGAASLEDAAEALLRLRPDLPDADLAALMADALTVANLTGRQEITDA